MKKYLTNVWLYVTAIGLFVAIATAAITNSVLVGALAFITVIVGCSKTRTMAAIPRLLVIWVVMFALEIIFILAGVSYPYPAIYTYIIFIGVALLLPKR